MAKQYDDDLEDEVVTPSNKKGKEEDTKSKKSGKASLDDDEDDAPKSKKGSKPVEDDDLDAEFGDEELMKGNGFLERLVPKDKNIFFRFSILPIVKPKKAYSHYVEGEGKGSFRCFSDHRDKKAPKASCCKALGEPGLDVYALVVHYLNADPKSGKMSKDKPVEFDIKFIKLSRNQFAAVSRLAEEDGQVYGIDIVMSMRSSGIGYEYNRIASTALYLRNEELKQAVDEAAEPFSNGEKLVSRLPKKITKAELNAYLAAANGDEAADMDEIEDI